MWKTSFFKASQNFHIHTIHLWKLLLWIPGASDAFLQLQQDVLAFHSQQGSPPLSLLFHTKSLLLSP